MSIGVNKIKPSSIIARKLILYSFYKQLKKLTSLVSVLRALISLPAGTLMQKIRLTQLRQR